MIAATSNEDGCHADALPDVRRSICVWAVVSVHLLELRAIQKYSEERTDHYPRRLDDPGCAVEVKDALAHVIDRTAYPLPGIPRLVRPRVEQDRGPPTTPPRKTSTPLKRPCRNRRDRLHRSPETWLRPHYRPERQIAMSTTQSSTTRRGILIAATARSGQFIAGWNEPRPLNLILFVLSAPTFLRRHLRRPPPAHRRNPLA